MAKARPSRIIQRVGPVCLLAAAVALGPGIAGSAQGAQPAAQARQILGATGVRGGLVVHLGCGDGTLTAALGAGDSYSVHGLDTDAANVAKARAHVQSLGLYGKVAVERWDGKRLPYVDNLANLIVASVKCQVSSEEVARVLAPRGVLLAKEGSLDTRPGRRRPAVTLDASASSSHPGWTKAVKPVPQAIDEWTHYLHGPSNNAVAQDTVVGPPRRYQWVGGPRWLRHHDHLSGFSAMVTAKGRLFYIVDLGPRWSVQMPPRWTLVARDAFNGTVLWQRPIAKWHAHLWPLKRGPAQLMRRLVAVGDTVYVTLGVGEPVVALDGATGELRRTYKGTEGTEEILVAGGVLFAVAHPELDAYKTLPRHSVQATRTAGARWNWDEQPRRLLAVEAATGRTLWEKEQRVAPVTLAAVGGRVYFHDGDKIVCADAKDGSEVWASKPVARWKPMHVLFGPTLVVHGAPPSRGDEAPASAREGGIVVFAGGEKMDPVRGGKDTMTALSAKTGETLWTAPHPSSGYASAEDLFVIDGLAWCGETTHRGSSGIFTGRDLRTGQVKVQFPPDDWPHMPHHRCHRGKATVNYILTSRTGIEFVDFRTKHWTAHHWVRGSCNHGIMPANGLLYAPPHSCACYPLAKLHSFNALAPRGRFQVPGAGFRAERLGKGPAFGARGTRTSNLVTPSEWPTYRGDAARSGSTSAAVPVALSQAWQTKVGGRVSAPVIAEGKLLVASIDTHAVHALDANSGKPAWRVTAGGRVDSPPTVWRGHVLFGSADGWLYCLRAADGALAWRFRAAPAERRMTAYGQVESVWPLHGSVLVHGGVASCVAGRAMWLDGGLRLVRLDAATGRLLSETVLDDKDPKSGKNLQTNLKWPNLPTALPDVLSCDGERVYMRAQAFDLAGKRLDVFTPRRYDAQRGETAHLFSPNGFLDGTWWHRAYWLWGRSFIGGAGGWYLAAYQAPAGRILCVDDASVYGFGRAPLRCAATPNSHHLSACAKDPKINTPTPKAPPRRRGGSVYGKVYATRLGYQWSKSLPLLARALVVSGDTLFAAGPPAVADELEVYLRYGEDEVQAAMAEHVAAFEGGQGAVLLAVSKADGAKRAAYRLGSAPVFGGMAAAGGRLFLSALDGTVLCLGAGGGKALTAAPDVELGPTPTGRGTFVGSRSHPDFQHVAGIRITKADIGYRMQTAPGDVGLALKKLARPLTKRAEFRVQVRPTPGAASPDTPGNGFIAFGKAPDDAQLVKCGFRIAGKRLYIAEGPLLESKVKGIPLKVKANEVAELRATVELATGKVTVSMLGETVEATLTRKLDAVAWVGCCIHSVTSDFGTIAIEGE